MGADLGVGSVVFRIHLRRVDDLRAGRGPTTETAAEVGLRAILRDHRVEVVVRPAVIRSRPTAAAMARNSESRKPKGANHSTGLSQG